MILKFILLFLAGTLTVSAYESLKDRSFFTLWPAIRLRHLWLALAYLSLVIITMLVLSNIPGLDWGYIKALTQQNGSVYTAAISTTPSKTDWVEKILPAWIVVALMFNLPGGVMAEERFFRGNAEHWSWLKRVLMQFAFGLAHLILGIPFFAALAIAVFGLLLTTRRLRLVKQGHTDHEAFLDGSCIHLVYNLLILLPLLSLVAIKLM